MAGPPFNISQFGKPPNPDAPRQVPTQSYTVKPSLNLSQYGEPVEPAKSSAHIVGETGWEFTKAGVRGTGQAAGLTLQGLAGLDPAEAAALNIEQYKPDILRVPEMTPDELQAFRTRVEQEAAPATRGIVQGIISDLLDGGITIDEVVAALPGPTPMADRPLYRAGEAVTEGVAGFAPVGEGWENSVTVMLGEGLGTLIAGGLATALTGGTVGGAMFASMGVGEAAQRAVQYDQAERAAGRQGLTDAQMATAAILGIAPGTTDLLPVELLLGGIKVPPMFRKPLAQFIGRVGGQAFTEGLQEGGQEYLQNIIAQTYDPSQSPTEGIPLSAGIGAGVGGMGSVLVDVIKLAAGGRRGRTAPRPQPAAEPQPPEEAPGVVQGGQAPRPAGLQPAPEEQLVPNAPPVTTPGPPTAPDMAASGGALARMPVPDYQTVPIIQSANILPDDAIFALDDAEQQQLARDILITRGQWPTQEEADILLAAGYTPDQIIEMDREARAEEVTQAREQGIVPQATPSPTPASPPSSSPPSAPASSPPASTSTPALSTYGTPVRGDGSRAAPTRVSHEVDVDRAGARVAPEPTPAQVAAGNYQKGHLDVHGLKITIETPRGGIRRSKPGVEPSWEVEMPAAYGYIKGTLGKDGEQIDVTIGDDPLREWAYIIEQNDIESGEFDEHKVVLGAANRDEAADLYARSFSDGRGRDRMGRITEVHIGQLKTWLHTGRVPQDTGRFQQKKPSQKSRTGKVREPPSLLRFLAGIGGIQDYNGELAALGVSKTPVPGFGRLVRKKGRTLDYAREAAAEAGYFTNQGYANNDDAMANTTVADLLDLIDREANRGERIYSANDTDQLLEWQAQRAGGQEGEDRARYEAERAVGEMIEEYGLTVDDETYAITVALVEGGMNPEDAFERATLQVVSEELDAGDEAAIEAETVPGWTDETDAGAIPESGERSRPEGAERPGARGDVEPQRAPAAPGGQDEGQARRTIGRNADGETIYEDGRGVRSIVTSGIRITEKVRFEPGGISVDRGPDADSRFQPVTTAEQTDAGEQTVLPGAEQISSAALARRKAEQPLKPRADQRPMDEGIFGQAGAQTDLVDLSRQPQKDRADDAGDEVPQGRGGSDQPLPPDAGPSRSTEPAARGRDAAGTVSADRDVRGEELPRPATGDDRAGASVLSRLRDKLLDEGFGNIGAARRFLKEIGYTLPDDVVSAAKAIDEVIEQATVLAAREIVARGGDPATTYDALVDLYVNKQPRLGVRTAKSMAEQAYSTPAPLAYIASRLAGAADSFVYEPTAGHGMLLIEAKSALANEIDHDRAAFVDDVLGFRTMREDATTAAALPHGQRPVVLMNPPFGAVREGGQSKVFEVGDYRTTQIDQAIALNALTAMEDGGRAVLIVGGVKGETDGERAEGYRAQSKRKFYARLYDQYRVVNHFTVSGHLYEKQGAAWPVDVIVIEGRGKSERRLPAADVPPVYGTWEALEGLVDGTDHRASHAGRSARPDSEPDGGTPETGGRPRRSDVGSAAADERGGSVRGGDGPARQPGVVRIEGGRVQPASAPGDEAAVGLQPASGGEPGRAGVAPPAEPGRARVEARTNTTGQANYQPASKGASMGTLVPINMRDSIQNALTSVAERHGGDLGAWVANELGYSNNEIYNYFGAEQIDAIALAIDNIQRGMALIIGDQTGIGKGRMVAAVLRYAMRRGLTPVFVTEKPDLYGDIYRDLSDIGMPDVRMMMTNESESVPLDEEALQWKADSDAATAAGGKAPKRRGRFLTTRNARDLFRQIIAGEKPADIVFTTYDQMNTVQGKDTARRDFLRAIAGRSLIALDESHNAGGQGEGAGWKKAKGAPKNRAEFFRELVDSAEAVLYSSATFAKRPNVMDLYRRTDMVLAVENPKMLPALIQKGGIPLQQAVSSELARAGQYVRRERSFEGIVYEVEPVPVDADLYADFTAAVRDVFEFDLAVADVRAGLMQSALDEVGAVVADDNAIGEAGANATEFSAIMHNLVGQMIFSIKADSVADRAIAHHKAGKRPLIAVANTMESFLDEYANEHNLKNGDKVDLTFADLLARYLQRTLRISIKHADKRIEHIQFKPSQLPAELEAQYHEVEKAIRAADFNKMPVSPIDRIRQKLTDAGMSVAEVTGRHRMLKYGKGGTTLVERPKGERGVAGKRMTIARFNKGEIDAVIFNRSGSTGVSMHADQKSDGKVRRMMIAQPEANIDTYMQTLGRTNRTGQLVLPEYEQTVAEIPAEVRPASVLLKKMASLNANTTAARKSIFTGDSVDFMNQYGDEVAAQLVDDDPALQFALGNPVKRNDKGELEKDGAMRRVLGRIVMLQPEEQERLIERLTESYNSLIAELDAVGENALEAQELDLQARTLDRVVLREGHGASPFTEEAVLERVSVKSAGRAMAMPEVVEAVAKAAEIDPSTLSKNPATALARVAALSVRAADERAIAFAREARAYFDKEVMTIKSDEARGRAIAKHQAAVERWETLNAMLRPGVRVNLDGNNSTMPAVVLSVNRRKAGAKNPAALSSWEVTFAVPDAARRVDVNFGRLFPGGKAEGEVGFAVTPPSFVDTDEGLVEAFTRANKEGREDRWIAGGNMLSAFDAVGGYGQIVNYTTESGDVRQGILLARAFDLDEWMSGRAVRMMSGRQVRAFLEQSSEGEVRSMDAIVVVRRAGRDNFEIDMPAARRSGGRYFTEASVRAAVNDRFEKKGTRMRAERLSAAQVEAAIDAMVALDAVFETTKDQDIASRIVREMPAPGRGALREEENPYSENEIDYSGPLPTGGTPIQGGSHVDLGAWHPDPDQPLGGQAQSDVFHLGARSGVEFLIALDKHGKDVAYGHGIATATGTSPRFVVGLNNPAAQMVAHHNHPSNSPLSGVDIAMLVAPGLYAVYAHGSRGGVSRAELTFAAWERKNILFQQGRAENDTARAYRIIRDTHADVSQYILDRTGRIVRGSVTAEQLDEMAAQHWETVLQVFARAGVINYESNYSNDRLLAMTGVGDHLEQAVRYVRKAFFGDAEFQPDHDRPARALRHPGDMGVSFETGRGSARGHIGQGRVAPRSAPDDRASAPRSRPKQLRLPGFEQPAWHGSKHVFDRFSLHKIGSGEGAQSYGWGLYFAGKKEVAEYYRKALSGSSTMRVKDMPEPAQKWMSAGISGADKASLDAWIKKHLDPLTPREMSIAWVALHRIMVEASRRIDLVADPFGDIIQYSEDAAQLAAKEGDTVLSFEAGLRAKLARQIKKKGLAEIVRPGRTYQVEIPGDDTMLDFDKTLGKQPDAVKKLLDDPRLHIGPIIPVWRTNGTWEHVRGQDFYRTLSEALAKKETDAPNWTSVVNTMNDRRANDRAASELLSRVGINGLRYEDQVSRQTGNPAVIRENITEKRKQIREWEEKSNYPRHERERFVAMHKKELARLERALKEAEATPPTYNYVIFDDRLIEITGFEQPPPNVYGPPPAQPPGPPRRPASAWRQRANRFLASVARPRLDSVRVKLQDKMLPWQRTREQIESELGVRVPRHLDVYGMETLFSGRAGERLINLKRRFLDPLIEMMRRANVTGDEVGEYLYARHARERNAAIREIDPTNDAGSGMADAEAVAILDRFHADQRMPAIREIVERIDELIRSTRADLVRADLLARDVAETWASQYEFYVPLRGFEASEKNEEFSRTGRGMDVRGPESRRALGRRSVADNPLAYIIMQAEQAIVRAEKNRVNKTLLRFVQSYPDPDQWTIYKGHKERRIDPATGMVTEYWLPPQMGANRPINQDKLFGVKIGGKATYIEIKNPALAQALRGMGDETKSSIIRGVMTASRFYAGLLTQMSPEFIVSNALRDIQTALVNITDSNRGGTIKAHARMLKDFLTLKAVRNIMAALRNPDSIQGREYARWFEEFRMAGGKVSYLDLNTIDQIKKRIDRDFRSGRVRGGVREMLRYIEDLNTAVENGVRLSAYIALRKAGVTQDEAAFIAKELTVNFNRKGEWSPVVNAAYLFFNASVQGGVRIAQAAYRSKKVRWALAGMVAFGMMMDLVNSLISGIDDDDDELNDYDAIPAWIKERNIIFMVPGGDGKYQMMPMPYGYSAFVSAGQQMMSVMRGKTKPAEAAGNVLAAFLNSFNPLNGAPSFWQFVAPTLLDPIAQIGENLTWYGGPIMPTKFDDRTPDSELAWRDTPEAYKWVARELNKVPYGLFGAGGNVGRSGPLDFSPEALQHIVEFAGGGLGRFIANIYSTGESLALGKDIPPEDIPFVRRLYGDATSSSAMRRRFYDMWDEVNQAQYELRKVGQIEGAEAAAEVRANRARELRLFPRFKQTYELLGDIADARRNAERNLSGDAYRKEMQRLDEVETRAVEAAERAWVEVFR